MVIRERRYTLSDLREIEQRPENSNKLLELINGEIREVPSPSPLHNAIVAAILYFLYGFGRSNNVGYAFGDRTSYILPNGDELIPDVSFVTNRTQAPPFPEKFLFAPDLVVEVFSPSNTERDLLDKAESFLNAGTRIAWIVYPSIRVVDVCHLSDDGSLIVRKVEFDGILDGEDVLPGFKLPVKDIFPPSE